MNLMLPNDDAFEPPHASSPTDRFIYEMQLYGHRPFQDEPDPRPLPEEPVVQSALTAIFDALFELGLFEQVVESLFAPGGYWAEAEVPTEGIIVPD